MNQIKLAFLRRVTAYLVVMSLCLPSLAQAMGDEDSEGAQTNYIRMPQAEIQETAGCSLVVQPVPGIADVNSDGAEGQQERVQMPITAQPTRQRLSIADFEDEGCFTRQTMKICTTKCKSIFRRKKTWAMICIFGSAIFLLWGILYYAAKPNHNPTLTP